MRALRYTPAPVLAVVLSAIVVSRTKSKPSRVAGLQHLAAAVMFTAAATRILPQRKHEAQRDTDPRGGKRRDMLGLKAFLACFTGSMALLLPALLTLEEIMR